MSAGRTVNGTLTLTSGKITTTSSNLLTLSSSATVSSGSASSFVDGPIAHTVASTLSAARTFPIGKDSAYCPVTLTVTQNNETSTAYIAEVFNSAPPGRTLPDGIDKVSTVRYWNVAKSAGANVTSASVKINYNSDDGVTDPTNLRIVKDDGAGNWVDLGGTGTGTPNGSITSTVDFTSFSDFTLGNVTGGGNSLPVELSTFTATASEDRITLHWRTESEVGNVGFTIYRSDTPDGKYTEIAFVEGAGNSGMSTDYQFTDKQVQPGRTYYYYLEDVDITGERSKSDVIQITINRRVITSIPLPARTELFANYPNPFNPETWFAYNLAEATDVTIQIYDVHGHLIRTLHLGQQPAGFYLNKDKAAYWDGRDSAGERVSSGIYFYRLSAGDVSATRRMAIVK